MQWSDIPFTPTNRTLRQFAGLWFIFIGTLGVIQTVVRDRPTAGAVFACLAITISIAGLLKPQLIRPVYVGSMVLTFPIGWVVSRIILACMYYGVFAPVGLAFRLTGRDVLVRRKPPMAVTYWSPKAISTDPRSYLRPF
jgi:hypothetical protein